MIANFLRILLWESIQNGAPIVGFIYATHQWARSRKAFAVVIVLIGMVLGSVAIDAIEPLIYREPVTFAWDVGILVNAIVFTILAVLGMTYINLQKETKWDIFASFFFGTSVTVSQAIASPFSALGIAAHIISLSISSFIFIRGTRWATSCFEEKVIWIRAFVINLIGSAIIVVIDYGHLIIAAA